jgi:peptidoglycan/LPS O-acetylase OafA/YrhL
MNALPATGPVPGTVEKLAPRSPRYESLTLWRGVACLLVVLYHSVFNGYARPILNSPGTAAWILEVMSRFWIGVPIFFVISGYCITASADGLRQRTSPGENFFWRRFRRIYPPYWIWLGVAALGVWVVEHFLRPDFFDAGGFGIVQPPQRLSLWQWIGNVTLTETWRWHWGGGIENEFLGHSWTLCYEEQFYAIVGLTLLFARRFFFTMFVLITVVTLGGFFFFPWLGLRTWGVFVDGKWLMFAAGILVYYLLNYSSRRAMLWWSLPLVMAFLFTAESPDRLLLPHANDLTQSCFVAFGFALLILLLHRWDKKLARAKLLRPLTYCGEMCYSLYLVHWPVVVAVGRVFDLLGMKNFAVAMLISVPVCVASAVGLAMVFHVLVERRFMNIGIKPG